jgi:hypothetical protein
MSAISLLGNGADPSILSNNGENAIQVSTTEHSASFTKWLVEAVAKPQRPASQQNR